MRCAYPPYDSSTILFLVSAANLKIAQFRCNTDVRVAGSQLAIPLLTIAAVLACIDFVMSGFLNYMKFVWLLFWLITATVILFLPIVTAALLSRTGNLAFTLCKIWTLTLLKVTGIRLAIRGRKKIDKNRSYIIISNHQSHFDIPALIHGLGIQYRSVIKNELRKIPLFGYALFASRNIFIDRSDHQSAIRSINEGIDRLPPGAGVLFFAEGTRSPDGRIQKFKKGGFI